MLLHVPVILSYKLGTSFTQRGASTWILHQIENLGSQVFGTPRFEELDQLLAEVILVNACSRCDNWHVHSHEFHNFCAKSFVAEGIFPLRNHPTIDSRHDVRDLLHRN